LKPIKSDGLPLLNSCAVFFAAFPFTYGRSNTPVLPGAESGTVAEFSDGNSVSNCWFFAPLSQSADGTNGNYITTSALSSSFVTDVAELSNARREKGSLRCTPLRILVTICVS